MKKQVLLLVARSSANKGLTHPKDLAKLLNETGVAIEVHAAVLEDLLYHFDGDVVEIFDATNERPLESYDVVYFRYWGQAAGQAVAAAWYCKEKNIPFVDDEVWHAGFQNKLTQYMGLYQARAQIPKTLIGNPDQLAKYYVRYGFSFPLIVKSVLGTRGGENYLVHSKTKLKQVFTDHPDKTFVMQAFIPNDRDYRVLVIGGEVVMVIERKAAGDTHLNNTSQGGSAKQVPVTTLPVEVRKKCLQTAAFFRRQIAGVDVVQSLTDGEYYYFEVNRSPQIEHASFEQEKAALLAEYLGRL